MARALQALLLGLAVCVVLGWPQRALAEPDRADPGRVDAEPGRTEPGRSDAGRAALDHRSTPELVAAAREAFSALRYRDAVGLLERAWRRGDSQPAQLRAIFALAGRAAASMGRDAAAELWFQRWLCLEPTADLPAGASPKLRGALSRARDALAGGALDVRVVRSGDDVELTIRDPLALVASVRTGSRRIPLSSLRITLRTVRGELELLDTYGNVLVSTTTDAPGAPTRSDARITATRDPAARDSATRDPAARDSATRDPTASNARWYQGWPSWAIAAGGFATISVAAWWIADDADQQARDVGDEAEEASLRRRRDVATWVSRGALVAMGVAITAGIVVYVRGRDQQVIATPQPGGGVVAWRITF